MKKEEVRITLTLTELDRVMMALGNLLDRADKDKVKEIMTPQVRQEMNALLNRLFGKYATYKVRSDEDGK